MRHKLIKGCHMEVSKNSVKSGGIHGSQSNNSPDASSRKYFFAVTLMVLFFSVVYSALSYLRYLTLNEHVFDLGVNASLAYSVLHGNTIMGQIFSGTVSLNKLIYIPVGIVYAIYPKEYMLPIYQNIFLSISGIFVFLIAGIILKSSRLAFIVSVLWFLYFPLSGVYWFDFHYMALFPTFFLSGIYFHMAGKRKVSTVLFAMGAITDLMSPVIIVLFIFILMIRDAYKNKKFILDRYQIIILVLSIFIFSIANILREGTTVSNYIGVSSNIPLFGSTFFKSEFIFRVLLPLFFIPLFGIEYLLLISPYIALIFSNSYWPYESQLFFQYPSLYIPAIFLSFIYGMKRIRKRLRYRTFSRILVYLVIFNTILFALYTPLGNLATKDVPASSLESYITGSSGSKYMIYENIIPTHKDVKFIAFMNEIPAGASVLVSGNLPQLMQGYNPVCPYEDFNITFPHYIPVDPYSRFFTQHVYGPQFQNCSVIGKVNYLLSNFHYGFVNEYGGMAIYALNSNVSSIAVHNSNVSVSSTIFNNSSLIASVPILPPGEYRISLPHSFGNISNVYVMNESYGHVVSSHVQGSNFTFSSEGYIQNLKFKFTSDNHMNTAQAPVVLSTLKLFAR